MPTPGALWPTSALDDTGGPERPLPRSERCDLLAVDTQDLPMRSTTFGCFSRWRDRGLFGEINHPLVMLDRARIGREASPSAAALDSQSIETTESGGPRGSEAGKRVNGRERQAPVDMDGRARPRSSACRPTGPRRGAVRVLRLSRRISPFIAKAFADAGYAGNLCRRSTRAAHARPPPLSAGSGIRLWGTGSWRSTRTVRTG